MLVLEMLESQPLIRPPAGEPRSRARSFVVGTLLVALLVTLLGVNLTGVAFCVLVAWRRELRAFIGRYRGLSEEIELRGEGREGTSKPAAEAEGERKHWGSS